MIAQIMALISSSSREVSVSEEISREASSMRQMIDVGVQLECGTVYVDGGSHPTSLAYSTKVVARCDNDESLNRSAPF